jgi:membrane AbrB-like protein
MTPSPPRLWLQGGMAIAACTFGGALCAWVGTPLPWILGALFTMAGLRLAGLGFEAPPGARAAGQLVIGAALGLYFTPQVAAEVLSRWEILVAAAGFALVLAYAGAFLIARLSDTDSTTAFFSSIPGGASEMAVLGERFGAKLDRIALAQSLRILIVVTAVPLALTALDVHGVERHTEAAHAVSAGGLAALLAVSCAAALILRAVRFPNAFMLGPLFSTIALTAGGVAWTAMPNLFSAAAQVLIGCALGSRFDRDSMRRAPRFVAVVAVSVVAALALSAGFAIALARLDGLSPATMVLATAPGGIAEMCITAKSLQLGVPLVTAAHVARVVLLVTLVGPVFRTSRWLLRRQA